MSFLYGGVEIPYDQYTKEGNAAQYAQLGFMKFFKRNPTAVELAQVTPIYVGGDPHITDISAGDAAVASLYQQEKFGGYSASGDPSILDTSPTIAPGSPPYNSVSTPSPVPGDGSSSLSMPASASAYQPSYIQPAGGVPAPATLTTPQTDNSFLIYAGLAIGAFFILKTWI